MLFLFLTEGTEGTEGTRCLVFFTAENAKEVAEDTKTLRLIFFGLRIGRMGRIYADLQLDLTPPKETRL